MISPFIIEFLSLPPLRSFIECDHAEEEGCWFWEVNYFLRAIFFKVRRNNRIPWWAWTGDRIGSCNPLSAQKTSPLLCLIYLAKLLRWAYSALWVQLLIIHCSARLICLTKMLKKKLLFVWSYPSQLLTFYLRFSPGLV